jgi:hypothetical protein
VVIVIDAVIVMVDVRLRVVVVVAVRDEASVGVADTVVVTLGVPVDAKSDGDAMARPCKANAVITRIRTARGEYLTAQL